LSQQETKKKPQPETKETKQTKKHTTTTKPKTNKTPRSGIATSNGNKMHDDILCVIMSMATEKEVKQRKHKKHTKGPGKRVRTNTAQCGNQGSPQPGSPRS